MEIGLGTSELAGVLEKYGYRVDYYDFGVALNSFRKADLSLCAEDKLILSGSDNLSFYLKKPTTNSILFQWANKLVKYLKRKKYDYICLSVERRLPKLFVLRGAINFGLVLANLLLGKYKDASIFMGGRNALKNVGIEYFKRLNNRIDKIPIDGFFLNANAQDFVQYIFSLESGKDLEVKEINRLMPLFTKKFLEKGKSFFIRKTLLKEKNTERLKTILIPKYDIENKDELYFDLKSFLPAEFINKYPEFKKIKPFYILPFMFTMGCPFKCAFCRSGTESHSITSAKKAVELISEIVETYDVTYFRFYNCTINFSKEYVYQFCNELKRKNLKIKFSDSANLRNVSSDLLRVLNEVGCIKLWYGVETPSPRLLKEMNKNLTYDEICSGLEMSAKEGIWNSVNLIVNFPHETEKDFKFLINFISEHKKNIDCGNCTTFGLLNGTYIYRNPKKYRIKIKRLREGASRYNFDEINGLKWEEKKALGEERQRQVYNLLDYYDNLILRNDYLLFGFSQVTDDRLKLKKMMQDYIKIVKDSLSFRENNNSFFEFAKNLDPENYKNII